MENTASKCMPEYDTFLIKALLFTSVLIESVLLVQASFAINFQA